MCIYGMRWRFINFTNFYRFLLVFFDSLPSGHAMECRLGRLVSWSVCSLCIEYGKWRILSVWSYVKKQLKLFGSNLYVECLLILPIDFAGALDANVIILTSMGMIMFNHSSDSVEFCYSHLHTYKNHLKRFRQNAKNKHLKRLMKLFK